MPGEIRRPRYTRVVRGNLFWEPPVWARQMGFAGISCGPDSHAARAKADEWNTKLDAARDQRHAPQVTNRYPPGSLGDWWLAWRSTESFKRKVEGTRAEFEYAWKVIGPELGDKPLARITPADIEKFQIALESGPEYRRWAIMKKLRGIFNAAIKYQLITHSPALTLPNPQPAPRQIIFRPDQIEAAWATAAGTGHHGLALAIRIMYEAALAPVDARTVTAAMLVPRGASGYIQRGRTKTGTAVGNALSEGLWRDLAAYIAARPSTIGPVLRRPDGTTWADKRAFNYDFAVVRKAAGLPAHLKPLDIRRTANLEAALGDASPADRAKFLSNTLDRNARLERTYTPETVEISEGIALKRIAGRAILSAFQGEAESGAA